MVAFEKQTMLAEGTRADALQQAWIAVANGDAKAPMK